VGLRLLPYVVLPVHTATIAVRGAANVCRGLAAERTPLHEVVHARAVRPVLRVDVARAAGLEPAVRLLAHAVPMPGLPLADLAAADVHARGRRGERRDDDRHRLPPVHSRHHVFAKPWRLPPRERLHGADCAEGLAHSALEPSPMGTSVALSLNELHGFVPPSLVSGTRVLE